MPGDYYLIRKLGMVHRLALLGGVLLTASCKSEGGVEPLVVTTVSVSSAPTQITVNGTAQASVIVKDQNGNPLTGKSIEWTSLNTNIATVTSAGVIRGVAPGTATIQGRVDGVVGTATVIVVAPVAACEGGATVVDPAPGAVRVITYRVQRLYQNSIRSGRVGVRRDRCQRESDTGSTRGLCDQVRRR